MSPYINTFKHIVRLILSIAIYFFIISKYLIPKKDCEHILKSEKLFNLNDLIIFLNKHSYDEYYITEKFKNFFISYGKYSSGKFFSDNTNSRVLIVPYTRENIIILINSFFKTKHIPCITSNIYFLKNQDYENLITHKKNNISYNETLEYVKNIFEDKDSFISMALDDIYLKD